MLQWLRRLLIGNPPLDTSGNYGEWLPQGPNPLNRPSGRIFGGGPNPVSGSPAIVLFPQQVLPPSAYSSRFAGRVGGRAKTYRSTAVGRMAIYNAPDRLGPRVKTGVTIRRPTITGGPIS